MSYYLVRSFDHAGYYETRLLLAAAVLTFVLWRLGRGDRRFLAVFAAGLIFQGLMEWMLALSGLRGAGYSLSLFAWTFTGFPAFLVQGLLEGGPLAVIAFAFVAAVQAGWPRRVTAAYAGALGAVCLLTVPVIILAHGQAPTSIRPMFVWDPVGLAILAGSLLLVALVRGTTGIKALGLFAVGIFVYLLVNFEPMHLAHVRYIALDNAAAPTTAGLREQIWVMGLSHAWEVTAGKLHYFAVPYVLGLLDPPRSNAPARIPAQVPTQESAAGQPTLVFLHGWLMSPDIWRQACARVEDRFSCIAPWQPAHGPVPAPDRPWDMSDWIAWLFRTADAAGADDLVLVGHSMGGMLALAAAAAQPQRIRAVVIVGSTAAPWPEEARQSWLGTVDLVGAAWTPELAAQLAPILVGRRFLDEHPTWLREWHEQVRRYALAGMRNIATAVAQRPDLMPRIGQLAMPMLVVHGAEDGAIPPAAARALVDAAPNAELQILDTVGHCPPLEAGDAFAEILRGFLLRRVGSEHV